MVQPFSYMNFLSELYPTILFVLNNHPDGGRIPLKLPSEDMNRGVHVPVDNCIPEVDIRECKKQAETKTLVEVQIQEKVECF